MNTVAQAKSGERTRYWIADQTNRSAVITQNLLLRLVTEQEEAEELCLMQGEVELESHSRLLHPRTLPPSPESKVVREIWK